MNLRILLLFLVLSPACSWLPFGVVHPISVGEVEIDPATPHTVGLSLPIQQGDEDFDATVRVAYREVDSPVWKDALPLQRVRTDTLSDQVRTQFPIAEQFAGSIFELKPNSTYEVRLRIEDPDGGATTRMTRVTTRALPRDGPQSPHIVDVDSTAALTSALAQASPGDVIMLAKGRYQGPFRLERSGTDENPIVVTGRDRDSTTIESPGEEYGVLITGSHVHLEDLTIRSSAWGIAVMNVTDVVIRRTHITEVSYGINGRAGANRDLYICDNLLEGRSVRWPDTSSRTWNYEGIVVTGAGHVICHNTLAGFGDALGLSQPVVIPNRAIDFYGNDVVWGGDDGIELDYSERNVRAFDNRFGNVAMGISFQPVWGGPVYAMRNVIYNTAVAPYKLNQSPSGFFILHNTSIRAGWAWLQYGAYASNFVMLNNLMIGTDKAVYVTPYLQGAGIDYNGWSPDGEFKFDYSWSDFSSLSRESPYERHGRLLTVPVFAAATAVPSNFGSFMSPPTLVLDARSNAVDAGVRLPNINDDYTGERPDIGVLERGREPPQYGIRWRGRVLSPVVISDGQ
ncbi:MAG TPA: hypothetical protein VJR03_02300 [Nitrospira sp.]|nr:hypothetical protein [Nitrospira sp.]